jgi:hypothetical protein
MIIEENHAEIVYSWLMEKLKWRSSQNMPPADMPPRIEDTTMQTWKDGKGGYILFTPGDSLMTSTKKWEVQVMIEYEDKQGFMRVGMQNPYTITMLTWEFHQLTQGQWNFFPLNGYRRLTDGTVVHRVTKDYNLFQAARMDEEIQTPPPKILEERGRGTLITNVEDQGRLVQYWAWIRQPLDVGVFIPTERLKIEYWMSVTLSQSQTMVIQRQISESSTRYG